MLTEIHTKVNFRIIRKMVEESTFVRMVNSFTEYGLMTTKMVSSSTKIPGIELR